MCCSSGGFHFIWFDLEWMSRKKRWDTHLEKGKQIIRMNNLFQNRRTNLSSNFFFSRKKAYTSEARHRCNRFVLYIWCVTNREVVRRGLGYVGTEMGTGAFIKIRDSAKTEKIRSRIAYETQRLLWRSEVQTFHSVLFSIAYSRFSSGFGESRTEWNQMVLMYIQKQKSNKSIKLLLILLSCSR